MSVTLDNLLINLMNTSSSTMTTPPVGTDGLHPFDLMPLGDNNNDNDNNDNGSDQGSFAGGEAGGGGGGGGGGMLSDEAAFWLEIVTYVILSGGISLAGSVANVINIVVFVKQGFGGHSVNISLLGLAVSDLGSLLTLLWMAVCVTPSFRASMQLRWDVKSVQYLTAGWPHVCFARITGYVTAYITFERCLCIALPLKVKRIITPGRTCVVTVVIYLAMFAGIAPFFYAARLTDVFSQGVNRTLLTFVYVQDGADIEKFTSSFNVFAQVSAIVVVIACTLVLVRSLAQKTKWRKEVATGSAAGEESAAVKDKRVIKMVTLVGLIFTACFLPSAINLLLMTCLPQYILHAGESNLFIVVWGFLNILEAINSSVNIFIYYNMSTAYRIHFDRLFKCAASGEKDDLAKI